MSDVSDNDGDNNSEKIRTQITAAVGTGRFMEAVLELWGDQTIEIDELGRELALMHNEGFIDVVQEFSSLAKGPSFFQARLVFEAAIPHLEANIPALLRCVDHLAKEAGHDMAAGQIVNDLTKFLVAKPERPEIALAAIEAEPGLLGLLPAVLISGSQIDLDQYSQQTLRLVQSDDLQTRREAIFALSRLKWDEKSAPPGEVYSALEEEQARATDDQLVATIVRTATALIKLDTSQEARMLAITDSALTKGGESSIHAAAEVLAYADKDISQATIELALKHLIKVNPENGGTVDSIDHGLMRLIKRGKTEEALTFVADLLVQREVQAEKLDSALAEIQRDQALLNKACTRWLLTGEPALCRAVEYLVGKGHRANTSVEIDGAEIDFAHPAQVSFISKTIAAYLFFNPVSAAGLLVSLMRAVSDQNLARHIGQILLDPILLNFPGQARELVEEQKKSGTRAQKKLIKEVLDALEVYFEGLRSIEELPELHPSESHRESHHRHQTRHMAEAMKAAEAQSVFLSLIKRQALLYGRSSINYVHGPEGAAHRQEVPLQSHSVEMEYPRVANLDPFGLDYQLRTFRAERWRKQ